MVAPHISQWYLADIHTVRGARARDLQKILIKQVNKASVQLYAEVGTAFAAAYKDADKNDRIIVFGSFYTVADAIKLTSACRD
jgi:dihydrofolate synthase/folylpolyglutamate synthase